MIKTNKLENYINKYKNYNNKIRNYKKSCQDKIYY